MMLRNKFPKDMSIRQRFKNHLCMAVQQSDMLRQLFFYDTKFNPSINEL